MAIGQLVACPELFKGRGIVLDVGRTFARVQLRGQRVVFVLRDDLRKARRVSVRH